MNREVLFPNDGTGRWIFCTGWNRDLETLWFRIAGSVYTSNERRREIVVSAAIVEITTPDELELRYHEFFDQLAVLETRVRETLDKLVPSQESATTESPLQ